MLPDGVYSSVGAAQVTPPSVSHHCSGRSDSEKEHRVPSRTPLGIPRQQMTLSSSWIISSISSRRPLLSDLLAPVRQTQVLATSREPLRLRAERE